MRRVLAVFLGLLLAGPAWRLLSDRDYQATTDLEPDAMPKAETPPPMLEARGPQPVEVAEAEAAPDAEPAKAVPQLEPQPTQYTIQGRIVGKDPSTPVPRGDVVAVIDAWRIEDGRARNTKKRYRAPVDRAGRFTFTIGGRPAEPVSLFEIDGADVRVERWYVEGAESAPLQEGLPALRATIDNRPDAVTHIVLVVVPTFRLQGIVVDEHGRRQKHVQVTVMRVSPGPGGSNVMPRAIHTDEDGAFDIGPFDVEPPKQGSMLETMLRVSFRQPGFSLLRLDPWSIEPRDRSDVRVVLDRGVTLAGSLVDPDGRALPGVVVEFEYGSDWQLRKATRTDAQGLWSLKELPRGKARVRALAFAHGCKVSRDMKITRDDHRVELVAEPVPRPHPSKLHSVLGLTLAEVDDATRKAYELPDEVHLLILEVPEDHAKLGIGKLEPGYGLWMVGDTGVTSLEDAVQRLVSLSGLVHQRPVRRFGPPRVRVVYTFANERMRGTNTQHMQVTEDDRKELEALAARLKER